MASRGDINLLEVQPQLYDGWQIIPFDKSLSQTGTYTKIKSSECNDDGIYPVIDQGEKYISGYIDDPDMIYKGELPVIIFGDHTRNIKYIDFEFAAGADGTKILSTIKQIDSKFFYFYLKSLSIPSLGYSRHYSILKQINIPLPPLAEQKRIADKIDVLFGQLETIYKATDRIPELIKNFRQQILTYAVTGRLTEEWREGKDQCDLYDVILNIKSVRIKNNAKSQADKEKIELIYSDDNSSIDFIMPDEWIPVNLDKICISFTYGTSAKSEEYGKYPVLRMGNIQKGKIVWNDLKYTSDEYEFKKYKVYKGDILFNRTNSPELVGKTAIFDTNEDACYAGYIIKISPCNEINSAYLNIVLNSQYAKRWCWENKSDGVSQSNINAQKISKFTVPYPHLSEQEEIVRRVQSLFQKVETIEQKYQILKTKLDNLPQALLNKAFKGELVEQLPSDGNAADLLNEIEQLKKSLGKK